MNEAELKVIKETLEKQLELLSQRSKTSSDLPEISRAMLEIAKFLLKPYH